MSLINQMLQDLESRRAEDVRSAVPNEIRPLPRRQPGRLGTWLGGGLLALALGGGGFLLAQGFAPAFLQPATPSAPRAAPGTPPALLPPGGGTPGLAEASAAVAPVPDFGASPPPVPHEGIGLRLSDSIAAVPLSPVAPPAASPARVAAKPVEPPPPAAAPANPSPKLADANPPAPGIGASQPASRGREARPTEEGRIEKTPLQPSAQEKAEAEYRRGIGLINQGQLKDGAEALRQCLRLDVNHAAARQLLVRLALEQRAYDDARGLLEEGARLQPGRYQWALTLARLLVDRNDAAAAWQALQGSMVAAGASADYQGLAGNVLQRLGRSREAADHYRAALRIAPNDGRWWLGLGLALEAEGNTSEARQAFQSARASGNLSQEMVAFIDQRLR